jgi:hypothetical protein
MVAWPSNSLNYNPIITKETSDACPSTAGMSGKQGAFYHPQIGLI